jgi:hypothetical protein
MIQARETSVLEKLRRGSRQIDPPASVTIAAPPFRVPSKHKTTWLGLWLARCHSVVRCALDSSSPPKPAIANRACPLRLQRHPSTRGYSKPFVPILRICPPSSPLTNRDILQLSPLNLLLISHDPNFTLPGVHHSDCAAEVVRTQRPTGGRRRECVTSGRCFTHSIIASDGRRTHDGLCPVKRLPDSHAAGMPATCSRCQATYGWPGRTGPGVRSVARNGGDPKNAATPGSRSMLASSSLLR